MTISSTKVVSKKEKPKQEEQPQNNNQIKSRVEAEVLKRLGTPKNLKQVEVSDGLVTHQAGRVNVWCFVEGRILPQPRILYSFYLTITPDGEIINSDPPIEKCDG